MPFSVNFAYHLTKQRSKEQQNDRLWFKRAMIVGIVAAALTVASVMLRISLDVAMALQEREEKKVLGQLETLKPQELAYIGYVSKVNVLSDLFKNRQAKQQALKRFRSLFGPGVSVTGLSYSEDSNDLGFQIKASSVYLFEQVVNQLDNHDIRQDYKDIAKSSINRSEDGSYNMSVSVGLNIISPTPTPGPNTSGQTQDDAMQLEP